MQVSMWYSWEEMLFCTALVFFHLYSIHNLLTWLSSGQCEKNMPAENIVVWSAD